MEGYRGHGVELADVPFSIHLHQRVRRVAAVQTSSVADAANILLPLLETENEMGRT